MRTILAAVLPDIQAQALREAAAELATCPGSCGDHRPATHRNDARTLRARAARLTETTEETAPTHVGGRVNAEDCPACSAALDPPPYPWICPGPNDSKEPTK